MPQAAATAAPAAATGAAAQLVDLIAAGMCKLSMVTESFDSHGISWFFSAAIVDIVGRNV